MHRKCFGQPELNRLAAESAPPSRIQEQLLCDSVVFYAVMHLLASRVHVVRFLRFAHFINAVEYPSSEVIAPLCLFALHDGMWWPTAVVACVAEGSPGRAGGKTQHFLQSIGITYVVLTPPQVADGYARTPAFEHVLTRAVFGHPPSTRRGDEQEFQSEPRPIYPPTTLHRLALRRTSGLTSRSTDRSSWPPRAATPMPTTRPPRRSHYRQSRLRCSKTAHGSCAGSRCTAAAACGRCTSTQCHRTRGASTYRHNFAPPTERRRTSRTRVVRFPGRSFGWPARCGQRSGRYPINWPRNCPPLTACTFASIRRVGCCCQRFS